MNPAVTFGSAVTGALPWREVPVYVLAQVAGAFARVACADAMFGEPIFAASRHAREGNAQILAEFVATFGLLSVIWSCVRHRPTAVPFAVGASVSTDRSRTNAPSERPAPAGLDRT